MGESYTFVEDGRPKYILRKLYSGTELQDSGQQIAVKLPFHTDLIEEDIVNQTHMDKIMTQHGFIKELQASFDAFGLQYLQEEYDKLNAVD